MAYFNKQLKEDVSNKLNSNVNSKLFKKIFII